jgi:mxaJ protein
MRNLLVLAVSLALVAVADHPVAARPARVLRVCADPNNLPFSSKSLRGFENELVALIARELHATVEYTWWAQRRGFVRSTLAAGRCDLIPGIPAGTERVHTTPPYYRSAYAFVTRADRGLDLRSLDDPRLRTLRVGVPLVGDDGANPPPVHALARRGIVDNVIGYSVFGDYRDDSPPNELVKAVARGDLDVAIAWGPLAGGAARDAAVKLVVTPIADDEPGLPMSFAIAMAVRKDATALARDVERVLVRRRRAIEQILDRHAVPRLPLTAAELRGERPADDADDGDGHRDRDRPPEVQR